MFQARRDKITQNKPKQAVDKAKIPQQRKLSINVWDNSRPPHREQGDNWWATTNIDSKARQIRKNLPLTDFRNLKLAIDEPLQLINGQQTHTNGIIQKQIYSQAFLDIQKIDMS